VGTAISKGERTRQSIIQKAAAVFNQRGYEGTSLTDLMEETGLEKGGIYRHFASKEELAVAAFDYAWSTVRQHRLRAIEGGSSPLTKLRNMIEDFAERPSVTPGGCPLLNTAVDADDGNPILRAHVRTALQGWVNRLEKLLQEGIDSGEIRKNIDPAAVASILVATLEGSMMMWRLQTNRTALEFARQHLSALLEDISQKR